MPKNIVNFSLENQPNDVMQSVAELGVLPDGTGLQIH